MSNWKLYYHLTFCPILTIWVPLNSKRKASEPLPSGPYSIVPTQMKPMLLSNYSIIPCFDFPNTKKGTPESVVNTSTQCPYSAPSTQCPYPVLPADVLHSPLRLCPLQVPEVSEDVRMLIRPFGETMGANAFFCDQGTKFIRVGWTILITIQLSKEWNYSMHVK